MGGSAVAGRASRAPLLSVLALLGLVALLTGLLGMHGLGAAGTHPATGAGTHAAPAAHPAAPLSGPGSGESGPHAPGCCAGHAAVLVASQVAPGAATLVPAEPSPPAPQPGVHAGELCLAVLAAGLFLLPLLLARARAGLRVPALSTSARATAAGARRFLPGPSLAALSVLRI